MLENFIETIKYKYIQCRLFFTKGTQPKTKSEKFWYEKALADTIEDVKLYENIIRQKYEDKYNSLIKCLTLNNIVVRYSEITKKHYIEFLDPKPLIPE